MDLYKIYTRLLLVGIIIQIILSFSFASAEELVSLEDPHYGGLNNDEALCTECHHLENTINIADGTIKELSPTNIVTQEDGSGQPDCVSCHDIGGTAPAHVNVTAMNNNNEIHKNLNLKTPSDPNSKCWACHGDGSEPSMQHHPTNYKTPRRCPDCHLPPSMGGGNHDQGLGCLCHFNIPMKLRTHLWNGTTIITPAATKCYDCHNKTEMLVYANDPDTGSGDVYGGENGGNNSPSHYGLKRTDMRLGGNANCSYCHQNTSTVFAEEMIDPARNSAITNHSLRYNSSNPVCADSRCHSTGLIHNNTLTKPSLTLPNSAYCTNCHGSSGSATIKNLAKHNGTVDCTRCHLSTARDIHPAKYLQPDASFNNMKSTGVNCINCHQTGLASFLTAAMVPNPMHHSDKVFNGSIWNTYWNSPKEACIYCHNDTKHSATPLGRILQFAPGYRMYGSIGTNTSCSNCHYKGDSNYSQMITAFTSSILNIPPEITNGTNWKGRSEGYFNHSIPSFQDKDCKPCHGSLLSSGANMSEFQHNVAQGGNADCISCHDIGGLAGSGRLVNFSAMNNTNAIHKNLNSGATTTLSVENKKCWACHGNGNDPGNKHPTNFKTPYDCEDCHIQGAGQNLNFTPPSILNVSQHYWNGTNIPTVNSCNSCHNKTEMLVGINIDPDGTVDSKNSAHYGKKRIDIRIASNESDCAYCHQDPTSEFSDVFEKSTNTNITHDNGKICYLCHREAGSTDGKIHDASLLGGSGGSCTQCHSLTGGATVVGSNDLGLHVNLNTTDGGLTDSDCMTCHYQDPHGGPDSITYFCADCHTAAGTGPKKSTLGRTFVDKLHGEITCMDCHYADGKYHQDNPRGSVANLIYVNRYVTTNTITTDCSDCHYVANLDDAPFNAPSGGSHIITYGAACASSCHPGGGSMIKTVHKVGGLSTATQKPSISVPTLSSSNVMQGTDVIVTATVNAPASYAVVDGAQYRIKSGTTEVKSWTPMSAFDGDFSGTSEVANATINTSNLAGTYAIEVRGMAGGPAQNASIRYYPMNGNVSAINSRPLTVQAQMGYINGTITSGDSPLGGALVSTDGDSDITGSDGTYSLRVSPGTSHTVTASKVPRYDVNTTSGIVVPAGETRTVDMTLNLLPVGTISGTVTG